MPKVYARGRVEARMGGGGGDAEGGYEGGTLCMGDADMRDCCGGGWGGHMIQGINISYENLARPPAVMWVGLRRPSRGGVRGGGISALPLLFLVMLLVLLAALAPVLAPLQHPITCKGGTPGLSLSLRILQAALMSLERLQS